MLPGARHAGESRQRLLDMAEALRAEPGGPGVLYFDPNPTTARLATAGLRLAGYAVHSASSQKEAVAMCLEHGPAGDKTIIALMLDTATSPAVSASVLRALVQVPGADQLPGILLVSRANPHPIPGAEQLPSLKRPFTTPALLKVLRETIDAGPSHAVVKELGMGGEVLARIELTINEFFPELSLTRETLESFTSALVSQSELPTPATGVAISGDVATVRLDSVLSMLCDDGVRGVLTLEQGDAWGRLHIDRGRVRMAESRNAKEDLRIGRFVVEAGFMTDEALEAIAVAHDGRPLGQRLHEDGHLRRGELARVLLNQAREITCHLLTWKTGKVTFAPVEELHPLAATSARARSELRINDALLEGLRRIDETAEMGPHMPGLDEVFVRVDEEIAKMGRNAFSREELGVLELLNGRNSLKEIARRTRTGTFSVAKVIYRLSRAKLARRRSVPVQV